MEGEYGFCPECGAPIAAAATTQPEFETDAVPPQYPNSVNPTPPKSSFVLTTKAKILIGTGLFVVLLLVGVYFLGKYLTDEARLIERFEASAQDEKSDKLFELLSGANEEIKFDKKTADGLIAYFKSNSSVVAKVTKELEEQAEQLRSGEEEAFDDDEDASFIYLAKKDEKRWLIYDDYELRVKRYMVPVQTNFDGAKILVDGKETAVASGDGTPVELGPFLPGEYSIEAVYQGEYTTLKNEDKVSLFPLSGYNDTVELELEGEYFYVDSNYGGARIHINGESIGLFVDDGEDIGPISLDGSNKLHLEAEYPWGTMVSEELPIDSTEMELDIEGLDDATKTNIMDAAHEFMYTWMQSFQAMDSSLLLSGSAERTTDLDNYIDGMKVNGQEYIGTLNRMTFDLDSINLTASEGDGYSVQVKAQVDYSEITYYTLDNLDPVPEDGTTYSDFELIYEDGQWVVTNWFQAYDIGTENTKVYE